MTIDRKKIDAFEIWQDLADSNSCRKAADFFESQEVSKGTVLQRGSTDFDSLVGCKSEKPRYKALYYMALIEGQRH